jgi:hypothetical protein
MDETASTRPLPQSPWTGIYGFPFQLNNLKVWLILTLCMILLAFNVSAFAGITKLIFSEIPEGQELLGVNPTIMFATGRYVYPALFVLAVIVTIAPSVYFLIIIQDSAAGNDEVDWPDEVWYDFIGKYFHLVWLFGCCAALSTVFWLLVDLALSFADLEIMRVIWWGLVLFSAALLLPIPLYSSMIAGSPWILLHPSFLGRLIEKPMAGLAIYVHSVVLLLPCIALGLFLIVTLNWWLSPIVGMFWAVCILWYGRALGRVGYVLAEERRRVPRKMKRKKRSIRRERAE